MVILCFNNMGSGKLQSWCQQCYFTTMTNIESTFPRFLDYLFSLTIYIKIISDKIWIHNSVKLVVFSIVDGQSYDPLRVSRELKYREWSIDLRWFKLSLSLPFLVFSDYQVLQPLVLCCQTSWISGLTTASCEASQL